MQSALLHQEHSRSGLLEELLGAGGVSQENAGVSAQMDRWVIHTAQTYNILGRAQLLLSWAWCFAEELCCSCTKIDV